MKESIFKWIAGSILTILSLVGTWAYNGMVNQDQQMREDLRIYQGKVDFYAHELAEIKATTERLDERTKSMQTDLQDIKAQIRR